MTPSLLHTHCGKSLPTSCLLAVSRTKIVYKCSAPFFYAFLKLGLGCLRHLLVVRLNNKRLDLVLQDLLVGVAGYAQRQ